MAIPRLTISTGTDSTSTGDTGGHAHYEWALLLGLLFLVTWALQVWAAPDQVAQDEIDYLLTRLETSGCQFFRNGEWYDATRARRHLEKKYAWLVKRDLVSTAEQFIERAATESSRSGDHYLVRCANSAAVPSAVWLSEELLQLRGCNNPRE